jgi:predicted double-glycine peptidase
MKRREVMGGINDIIHSLNLEAQIAHASEVSLNKLLTVLFSLFKNTLISNFFGFRTSTAWFQWLSVLSNRKHTRMC